MIHEIPEAIVESVPEILRNKLQQHWQNFCESLQRHQLQIPEVANFTQSAAMVFVNSEFCVNTAVQCPDLVLSLFSQGHMDRAYASQEYSQSLCQALDGVVDEQDLMKRLRIFRRREMCRIAWRDLAGWSTLSEMMQELSLLADACILQALHYLQLWQSRKHGIPYGEAGEAEELTVVAMGKLGANELNFSSDVDLIFCYPSSGETADGPTPRLTSEQFFTQLAQALIRVLHTVTEDGFVFRVDMRLRPFGESGPLVVSEAALNNYFLEHGRDWERYAWIKARVLGSHEYHPVQALANRFVYRRFLDFGVVASLRTMKALINREVQRRGLERNVKLGSGGIREVEFIAQTFQLIRGGDSLALQQSSLSTVLDELVHANCLPQEVINGLRNAYEFLRRTEHRLQFASDRQTQDLPMAPDAQASLAFSMGFSDWDSFFAKLSQLRSRVHYHFQQMIAGPGPEQEGTVVMAEHVSCRDGFATLWSEQFTQEQGKRFLQEQGFQCTEEFMVELQRFKECYRLRQLSEVATHRLDSLMPLLLSGLPPTDNVVTILRRILLLLENIVGRSNYLALLSENPPALSQLTSLFEASPWVAEQLRLYPVLLNELLAPLSLDNSQSVKMLSDELRQSLLRVPEDDLEQQMECLRQFKHTHVLRTAAVAVRGDLALKKIAQSLTQVAEVILQYTLHIATADLQQKHGRPTGRGAHESPPGFAIIAYGTLGTSELSYASDLDLVFLHNNACTSFQTDGERAIDNAVFFTRVAQRVIHLLNTRTSTGVLYHVDTRLRPSGSSGLLVSRMDAFASYQRESAWTWEHQALVRARFVAGSPALQQAFEALRREVLMQRRDLTVLQQDIVTMRQRLIDEAPRLAPGEFDLKHGRGGVSDIEFIIQYAVLAWSHQQPELIEYMDNEQILACLSVSGLMALEDARCLSEAYHLYRSNINQMALQQQPPTVVAELFADTVAQVSRIWQQIFGL